jgi:hypothetical protein
MFMAAPEPTAPPPETLSALTRRGFIAGAGLAGAAAVGAAVIGCGDGPLPYVDAATQADTDRLNFALNLEFLEATFYSYLVTGSDISSTLTGGGPAPTGAPAQLTFPNAQINNLFAEILFDEVSHVGALRTALGQTAIARPQLNLSALGPITTSNYLQMARLFEDIGVTAYAGVIGSLSSTNSPSAAQILAAEGFHAGALRLIAIQQNASYPAGLPIPADGYDIKPGDPGSVANAINGPTTANGGFFATAANGTPGQTNIFNGFAYQRSTSQVLAIMYGNTATGTAKGGLFPNGFNGNIVTV